MTGYNDNAAGIPPLPPPTGAPVQGIPAPGQPAVVDAAPLPPGYADTAVLPPELEALFNQDAEATQVVAPLPDPQPVGAAFGPAAVQAVAQPDAQPALQWAPPATVTKKKGGAAKTVGITLGIALLAGAAGIGGAFYGASIAKDNGQQVQQNPVQGSQSGNAADLTGDPQNANATTGTAQVALPSVVTLYVAGDQSGGSGSGVIISEDGYILTNTHVVTLGGESADASVSVTTVDGRIFDAEVIGLDPLYDLAVIKIDATGLDPIEFADSDKLAVGQATVALGAPLGLENSVTSGIVSALHRSLEIQSSAVPEAEATQDAPDTTDPNSEDSFQFGFPGQGNSLTGETISIAVIQTDASINQGNSGGALVDANGDLIGINVAIVTAGGDEESAGSVGLGFAIPSNIAKRIADEIMANGSATHGLLGATVGDAEYRGADHKGAFIVSVVPGGAAEAAGLLPDDIVVSFNGYPIRQASDLTAQVRALAAGTTVSLEVLRNGVLQTIDNVTLGELTG